MLLLLLFAYIRNGLVLAVNVAGFRLGRKSQDGLGMKTFGWKETSSWKWSHDDLQNDFRLVCTRLTKHSSMLCVSHGGASKVDAIECAGAIYDECRMKAVRSFPDLDTAHVRAIFAGAAVSPMRFLVMTGTEHLCPWCLSPDVGTMSAGHVLWLLSLKGRVRKPVTSCRVS